VQGGQDSPESAVRRLYDRLIEGWNAADADAIASVLAAEGLVVGFDGSQMSSREAARSELSRVFQDHATATYVTKERAVRALGEDAGLLHAVAGMVPPGGDAIMQDRNAIQTVVAHRDEEGWRVVLFQSTPARFDGRPELGEALTAELDALLVPDG
jgi:uncharacterized protein (TIGR02246 family)